MNAHRNRHFTAAMATTVLVVIGSATWVAGDHVVLRNGKRLNGLVRGETSSWIFAVPM